MDEEDDNGADGFDVHTIHTDKMNNTTMKMRRKRIERRQIDAIVDNVRRGRGSCRRKQPSQQYAEVVDNKQQRRSHQLEANRHQSSSAHIGDKCELSTAQLLLDMGGRGYGASVQTWSGDQRNCVDQMAKEDEEKYRSASPDSYDEECHQRKSARKRYKQQQRSCEYSRSDVNDDTGNSIPNAFQLTYDYSRGGGRSSLSSRFDDRYSTNRRKWADRGGNSRHGPYQQPQWKQHHY